VLAAFRDSTPSRCHRRQRNLHVWEAVPEGTADIFVTGLAATLFTLKANPILVILLAALLGILLYRNRTKPKPRATVMSPVSHVSDGD